MPHPTITAVLWDFGGVILSSPFDAFAAYEGANGLPEGLIRRLNAANPDTNAWAKYERSDVSFEEFCDLFEAEAAVIGHTVDARDRKSTRLNSSHLRLSRMPSSA